MQGGEPRPELSSLLEYKGLKPEVQEGQVVKNSWDRVPERRKMHTEIQRSAQCPLEDSAEYWPTHADIQTDCSGGTISLAHPLQEIVLFFHQQG